MNTLYIDSSSNQKTVVRLGMENKELEKESSNVHGSQALLGLINTLLEEARLKKEDLNKIEVNAGPGSFTGLRVGVSVANAMAFSLNIPVNGKRIETNLNY